MSNGEEIEFRIEVGEAGAADEELDQITRRLLMELKETDVETVELASAGDVPVGVKIAEVITIGAIVMTVLPVVLPKIIDMLQAWITQGKGRTVKFKGKVGKQQFEFEGSPEELRKLLKTLGRGVKK